MNSYRFLLVCVLVAAIGKIDAWAENRRHKEVLQAIRDAHVETFDLRTQIAESSPWFYHKFDKPIEIGPGESVDIAIPLPWVRAEDGRPQNPSSP